MALIPVVGRKSAAMRFHIAGLYILLTLGSITMIYPFLVMLSTSVKSGVDVNDYAVLPRYFRSDAALFSKYAEIKYAGDIDIINQNYGTEFAKVEEITPPQRSSLTKGESALVADWDAFRKGLPLKYKIACYGVQGSAPSMLLNRYREFLRLRFKGDISALNRAYTEENTSFDTVFTPFERPTNREWQPDSSPKMADWAAFLRTLPEDFHSVVGSDPLFASFLKEDKYNGEISALNAAYGTHFKSFAEVHLSPAKPAAPAPSADWEEFVRRYLPFRYMTVSQSAAPAYRAFLAKRYSGSIATFNRIYGSGHASFEGVTMPKAAPASGTPLVDWMDFIAHSVPLSAVKVENAENLFRESVMHKYGSLAAVNRAYGTSLESISRLSPPHALSDWSHVLKNRPELRKYFLTCNYGMVITYILLHGRAVANTVIFCLAVILTHLIVNPLCAYALSRYNLSYSYKVLLFLLATMAFPAEVAMIPNFLLLKQLGMLNSFWALILPGMASGFSIFLLKGFFDSLPKELYEAAIIDGATEPNMFWKITVPLSKPIFAVIALQSFTAAYGAFMFAFLVCQDPKMWTMMVWLYELQITAPKYITMAALTVAAVPTLIIFIFTQRVIMRGIILPSFK